MSRPWPCSRCGALGAKNLGALGLCTAHLAATYSRLSPDVWAGLGIGIPQESADADGLCALRCAACGATWTGGAFEACPWCWRALQRQRDWQAAIVLTAPDVDVADRRYDAAIEGWADRLAVAVKAELITEAQAHKAWEREVGHVAA